MRKKILSKVSKALDVYEAMMMTSVVVTFIGIYIIKQNIKHMKDRKRV
jgi:hypothetical protein|tara:strand:- start:137 stop:280 length:144 start_codon:yes stop_codon:yes gene_type:complete